MLICHLICFFSFALPISSLADEAKEFVELKKVFDSKKLKLPDDLRARVGDVKLARRQDLGVGNEVPLEYRLLNRVAYASFSILERTLTAYDARISGGLAGRSS